MRFNKPFKIIIALLSVLLILSLCIGCDTNNDGNSGDKTDNSGGDATVDKDSPIAYFSFDSLDGNGYFYNEVDGNAANSYGNPSQGEGKNGNSLSLNGSSYLSIKDDLPLGNSPHSVAVWTKLDHSVINYYSENVIAGWGEYKHLSDTRLTMYLDQYCVSSYDVLAMYPTPHDADSEWYHLAMIYNGRGYTFYLNGVECRYVAASEGIDVQESFLYIGGFYDRVKFAGQMDDLYVFDKAISREEVLMCMNNSIDFDKKAANNELPISEQAPIFDINNAELVGGINEFIYKSQNDQVAFELVFPDNYDPNKKYPLMLFLHGDGSNGQTPTDARLSGECTVMRRALVESGEDFIGIIPCASSPWLVVPNDKNTVYPYRSYSMTDAIPSYQLLAVIELMNECIDNLSVDTDRIYLAGYSRGTMASWYLLSEMPEKFAGSVLCCGAGDPSIAQKFANVPLWVFMGDADPLVDYSGIKGIYDAYEAAGGKGHFTTCKGGGHGLETYLFQEADLIKWLFSQTRASK